MFLACFNQIDGLKVEIESIKKGSIKAKLKGYFESDEAKKDGEKILGGVRKLAESKLEKEYTEMQKVQAEKKKTEVETEKLKRESELRSKELEAFEMLEKKQELENKLLELKVRREELQLFQEQVKTLEDLLAKEIISAEHFKMLINGLPFLIFNNNTIEVGASFKELIQKKLIEIL
ncbi:MAG: hypothetical protein AAGA02_06375 [Bacteroidota bacterium]